jgi:hypothetical protein
MMAMKKILVCLLVLMMMASIFTVTALAAEPPIKETTETKCVQLVQFDTYYTTFAGLKLPTENSGKKFG